MDIAFLSIGLKRLHAPSVLGDDCKLESSKYFNPSIMIATSCQHEESLNGIPREAVLQAAILQYASDNFIKRNFVDQMSEQFQIFDYDDILLLPRLCAVKSRSECDVSATFGGYKFTLPVVPANMRAVLNEEICEHLAKNNYFYIMHRFEVDTFAFVKRMLDQNLIASVSVGIKEADCVLIDRLHDAGLIPQFITIDIAHGHSVGVRDMIKYIKDKFGNRTFLIAGNVATPEAVVALEEWGADCVKVGVGPGKVCITRNKTGFGTGGWQLSAVKWCVSVATKPIIADGGIRHHGDIAKSLRFGATMVMCGSIFAGLEESPGKTVEVDHVLYKEYYGSASIHNKNERKNIEGKRILEPIKCTLNELLQEIKEDLQSSVSYAGGSDLSVLPKCSYVIIGGLNKPEHIFARHSGDPTEILRPRKDRC